MANKVHQPVLLQEVIDALDPKPGDIVFDGTVGEGGHTESICEKTGGKARIIAFDMDEDTLEVAKETLVGKCADISFHRESFENVGKVLKELKVPEIDKALLDLGVSSRSLEISGRGFSFQKDEPLLMTYSALEEGQLTARDIVNHWREEQIEKVLRGYGGERYSRQIAKMIVESREDKPIETTRDLVEIVERAVPRGYKKRKIHPATKTFQALRIAVNDEIGTIERGLENIFEKLSKEGRLAVITFHSLEDRTVKNIFKKWQKEEVAELLYKKPIVPSVDEIKRNKRARSAKLRVIIKTSDI